ncbi:unnamed protein product [Allacma fusca]|uniref:Uncharacterized protein n=1 Tax=Allacma fusca TaxID=39272 RepID=A0A8J2LCQ1_9HEXA|nr:unnamed protein product [Allacma fusca]
MEINSFTKRWTFFSEPVTVECAAQKIMYGVLHRKEHIFFSPFIRLVRLLRDILPPEATRKLYDFAGVLPNHVEVEQD